MTRSDILEACREIIYESVPELEGKPLGEDSIVNTDAGIDSMGFTLIMCRLEARLGVKIPDRQWAKLNTLGDVVSAFEKRLDKA